MGFNPKSFLSFLWIVVELVLIQPQFLCAKNTSQTPDEPYISYFGGRDKDVIIVCAILKNGNKIIAGDTRSDDLPVTPNCHQSKFNYDGITTTSFLACFDSIGSLVWCTYFGKDGYTRIRSGLLDEEGNFVISGETSADSLATIGKITIGNSSLFVAKFSPSGNLIWCTYLRGGDGFPTGIAIDRNNKIYLTGRFSNKAGFSFHDSIEVKGLHDIFCAILAADGAIISIFPIIGNKQDFIAKIAVDEQFNIFLSIRTNSDTIFGANSKNSYLGGSGDIYLMCLDSLSSFQWGQYIGSKGRDDITDINVGGLIATKTGIIFSCLIPFDSTTIVPPTAPIPHYSQITRGLLAKYDFLGSLIWATYSPGGGERLFIDSVGMIYEANYTNDLGFLYFSDTTVIAKSFQPSFGGGIYDGALYVYEPNGKLVYGTFLGGNDKDDVVDLNLKRGKLFCVGLSESDSTFTTSNAFQKRNNGLEDGLIASFNLPVFNTDIFYNTLQFENSNCKGLGSNKIKGSQPEGGNGIYTYSWLVANSQAGPYNFLAQQGKDLIITSPIISKWYKRVVSSGTKSDTSNAIVVSIGSKGNIGFSMNKAIQCYNQNSFEFEDTTFNANAHLWDFGDGTFSIERKPSKTYNFNVRNLYEVRLINAFNNNCFDTLKKQVYLISNPIAPQVAGNSLAKNLTVSKYTYNTNQANSISALVQNGKLEIVNDTIKITWQKAGLDTLKVWAINAADCISDTTLFPINIEKAIGLASKEDLKEAIEIYPNPALDYINIQNNSNTKITVELFNNFGQKLNVVEALNGLESRNLIIKHLPEGTYIAKITSLDFGEVIIKKVVVVK